MKDQVGLKCKLIDFIIHVSLSSLICWVFFLSRSQQKKIFRHVNGNLYSFKAIKYFVSDNKFSSTVLLLEAAVNRCSMYCLFTEIFQNSQAPESELLFSKTTCKIYKITCFYLIIISSLHEYLHVNFHITSAGP